MLKILILMFLTTTLLATHPVELDKGKECSLLSEDDFVTKDRYRMRIKWTLEKLEKDVRYIIRSSKYLDCLINDEKSLKAEIEIKFSYARNWRYMTFIKDRLLSKVHNGVKLGVVLNGWQDTLEYMMYNVDELLIKEPNLSGRGERRKLTTAQMELNKLNVSLRFVILIEVLNKKDVLFTKYQSAYRERIEDWAEKEWNRLTHHTSWQRWNRYVLKSDLLKEDIHIHSKTPFLETLRQVMMDSILVGFDDNVLELSKIRSRVSDELDRVRDKYLETKEDSLRFVNPLFEELYKEDKVVYFSFPSSFGFWLSNAAVHEKPDLLGQDYQEILLTWKSYHTETIKVFVEDLRKKKKNPERYYLSRTKLAKNLSKSFDQTKVEDEIPSGFYLIEKLLLEKLPTQEKISLAELAIFWQQFLDTSITEAVIQEHFKKYYTIPKESKWMDFLIVLFPSLPTSKELVETLRQSEF